MKSRKPSNFGARVLGAMVGAQSYTVREIRAAMGLPPKRARLVMLALKALRRRGLVEESAPKFGEGYQGDRLFTAYRRKESA